MIIWCKDLLDQLSKINGWIEVQIGNKTFPIIGVEESQSVGWWEIRYCSIFIGSSPIDIKDLINLIPEDGMVMLQEDCHSGRSYPLDYIKQVANESSIWLLVCEDPEKDYWEELKKADEEGKIYND